MSAIHTHQNASGSGLASRQRTASISALPLPQPSTSSLQAQNQAALPQHFIVRPGVTKHTASGAVTVPGPIVPLVAVDQLPEWLDLFGVPRELSLEQTVGLSNLGAAPRSPEFYTVYMHGDFRPAATAAREGRSGREGKGSAMLVPSDMSTTSGPPSAPSSTASTPASPLSSRMDPGMKPFPSGSQTYANDTDKKTVGNSSSSNKNAVANGSSSNTNPSKKPPNTSPRQPAVMSLGLHQRLPSPTATGSTPPTNSNPYPMLHPYPHPQLHPPPYPQPPYAMARPPPAAHPAERLLYSWTPPSLHSRPNAPKPSTTRQKPGAPSSTPNNGGSSTTNSMYCKHWCHRGTCRWGAQCRYAHAMPATAEGLREVGLSHHPAWWTTAFNMAYGSAGFGLGGAWYPPPHAHLPSKHYGGSGRKAQKERERGEKGKEREKDREGAGKGKGIEVDGNRRGSVGGVAGLEGSQLRKDGTEGQAGMIGGQEQRKPEQPKEEPKLVEI
ncbi:hypothetical protein F4781DRAFT_168184 [Annulohypoxylon bovei var. microspora]|nr:hypothetical protein F4781DRAFT_168184 [Annulohypoxylon bovei var. microspora]